MFSEQFRDFSSQFYRRDTVKKILLAAQEQHQLDINMLLLACWLGSLGWTLGVADWLGLSQSCHLFRQHLLLPLRALRQSSSHLGLEQKLALDCKRLFLQLELELEWREQQELINYLHQHGTFSLTPQSSDGLAKQNLLSLLEHNQLNNLWNLDELVEELEDFKQNSG